MISFCNDEEQKIKKDQRKLCEHDREHIADNHAGITPVQPETSKFHIEKQVFHACKDRAGNTMVKIQKRIRKISREPSNQRKPRSSQLVAIILLIGSQREGTLLPVLWGDVISHDVSSCQGKSHFAVRNDRMLDQLILFQILSHKVTMKAEVEIPHRTSAGPRHA